MSAERRSPTDSTPFKCNTRTALINRRSGEFDPMTDLLNGFTGRLHDLIAQIAVFIANFAVDTNYFHKVCLLALGGAAVLLVFVIVERMLYYALCSVRMIGLFRAVSGASRRPDRVLGRRNALNRGLSSYVSALRNPSSTRSQLEDLSAAQFIRVSGLIGARLWLLDTVVTAAPLLGLLGTILGIMDTFNALSAGGISDPSAVSRGIGNALLATAIGIAWRYSACSVTMSCTGSPIISRMNSSG